MSGDGALPVGIALSAPAFDRVAAGYDDGFSATLLGRWLREAVWEKLDQSFQAGDHVLELGCGTGDDAIHLAQRGVRVTATDDSPAMLAMAAGKAARAGVEQRVRLARWDFSAPATAPVRDPPEAPDAPVAPGDLDASAPGDVPPRAVHDEHAHFDGAFSNFGALNCVPDRGIVARSLAERVRPGGRVVLVAMGPICGWEIGWHLVHAQPRTAFRRLRAGRQAHVGSGENVRVWYPSPARLRSELSPWFRPLETVAIGLLLPPSYLSNLVERWGGGFSRLRPIERRLARLPGSSWLSDHYLVVLERR